MQNKRTSAEFEQKIKRNADAVNAVLERYLGLRDPDFGVLYESMRYSSLGGGKRVRAFLALEFFSAFCQKDPEIALPVACAIEMIHTYSLIHDDLPCMDDDDYRRGQPSNHKKFGEAVALLSGDALLTYAFGIIADAEFLPDEKKVKIISEISRAAGHSGMVGGQVMDMSGKNKEFAKTHALKTGALIVASARSGCIAGGAGETETEMAAGYAKNIGLAFQIIDDILDIDEKSGKSSFLEIYGGDGERAFGIAQDLTQKALAEIYELKKANKNISTENLEIFAEYLLERRN